jgi:DNA mismatch repair protein MutL
MASSDIINLLPDSIANQIAAGEVVQRPSSVIKELLENSIDAGSQSIDVVIRDAGRTLIQIIDDGSGMSETDARMSFERHATSKIKTSDDLFRIKTMGFRGEALASIAAVSQVEIKTRRHAEEMGTLLRIEGSELKTQEPTATAPGTNFQVKNLFFNVPARRNFLKTNSVEMRHLLDEFQRIAISNPEVAFTLKHNDTDVFNLPATKLARRIVDIFGKNYRNQLTACQEDTSYITVNGYIGKPEFARKTRGEQYFFVNNRFIKSSYLHHAVTTAFEGTIPEGSHPFYVLFLEIDPAHIDINIHPTKTEIKFDDERSVYAIVMAAVKKAVGVHHLSPIIDFNSNVNFLSQARVNPESDMQPIQQNWTNMPAEPQTVTRQSSINQGIPQQRLTDWNKLYPQDRDEQAARFEQVHLSFESKASAPIQTTGAPEPESFIRSSKVNDMNKPKVVPVEDIPVVVQLHNRYLISQHRDGLMLISQKAAYERILFERFRQMLQTHKGSSQQLLFPQTIRINPADMMLVNEMKDDIRNLGFEFDQLGPGELVIRGIPSALPNENEQNLFEELLEQLKSNYSELKVNKHETMAKSLARKFSSRYNVKLSTLEIQSFIAQLFSTSDPNRTPGGEPVIVKLTMEKVASLFKN